MAVTGKADFADSAGSGVTLDNAGNTYGTLRFNSTGAVVIVEADGTNLLMDSTAASLDLDSGGVISD